MIVKKHPGLLRRKAVFHQCLAEALITILNDAGLRHAGRGKADAPVPQLQ